MMSLERNTISHRANCFKLQSYEKCRKETENGLSRAIRDQECTVVWVGENKALELGDCCTVKSH